MRLRALSLGLLLTLLVALPASAKTTPPVGRNPTYTRLASQFLLILENKDQAGLEAFLSPAFLLQRPDGTWLTKAQYLKAPSVVAGFRVTNVHGTTTGDVKVIRYTAITDQTIDGKQITNAPVPRLSTYVRVGDTWQIVSHANFSPIPK